PPFPPNARPRLYLPSAAVAPMVKPPLPPPPPTLCARMPYALFPLLAIVDAELLTTTCELDPPLPPFPPIERFKVLPPVRPAPLENPPFPPPPPIDCAAMSAELSPGVISCA